MSYNKITVLFITGSPRSGSTILSRILGQIPGFFHGGELRFIWDRNFLEGFPCGCGRPFNECPIWAEVFLLAFGGFDQSLAERMLRDRETYTRTKHIPLMLTQAGKERLQSKLADYLINLEKLYHAIQATTSCKVIIDSSKFSSYGYILNMIPSLDVHFLHLIRDSRAVAFSRQKTKKWEETGIYMARYSPFRSSLQWTTLNLTSELIGERFVGKYLRLKYEDFVQHPNEAIKTVTDYVGVTPVQEDLIDDHYVSLVETHSNWGNPVRTQSGNVHLQLDDEWKQKAKYMNTSLVSTLTFPLLFRYGYL
jgi:Sulfotransferase family